MNRYKWAWTALILSSVIFVISLALHFLLKEKADPAQNLPGFEFAQEGLSAPPFSLKDLSGNTVHLEDYSGTYLLLNFWATWCPPCREEIPSLEAMRKSLEGSHIQLLTISIGESLEDVQTFVESRNIGFRVALDEDSAVSNTYAIDSIPTTFLISPEGEFIARKRGSMDWNNAEWLDFLEELGRD